MTKSALANMCQMTIEESTRFFNPGRQHNKMNIFTTGTYLSFGTELSRWLCGDTLSRTEKFKLPDKLLQKLIKAQLVQLEEQKPVTTVQATEMNSLVLKGNRPVDLAALLAEAKKQEEEFKEQLKTKPDHNNHKKTADDDDDDRKTNTDKNEEVEDEESVSGFSTEFEYMSEMIKYANAKTRCAAYQFRQDSYSNMDEEELEELRSSVSRSHGRSSADRLRTVGGDVTKALTTVNEIWAKIQARLQKTVVPPRLQRIASALELDEFDQLVLVVLIDSELNGQAVSNGSNAVIVQVSGQTPMQLVHKFATKLADRITLRKHFYKNSKLVKNGFITVISSGTTGNFSTSSVTIDRRFSDFLLGLDTEISEVVEGSHLYFPTATFSQVVLPEHAKQQIKTTVDSYRAFKEQRHNLGLEETVSYGTGVVLMFYGPSGTGKTMTANALAKHLNKKVLLINFPAIAGQNSLEALKATFREALVNNALLFFDECEAIFETREHGNKLIHPLLTEIERFTGVTVLATNRPHTLDEAMRRRITLAVEFKAPDHTHREKIWNSLLPEHISLADDVNFHSLALQYELSGGLIKNAVLVALCAAIDRDPDLPCITQADFHAGCKTQLEVGFGVNDFYHKVTPKDGLDKVLLADPIKQQLRNVVLAAKAQKVLAGSWGFDGSASPTNNQGITVLFSGPPGTGKTLAASAIGFEVGQPLKVVNSSQLIDKWVGETSKNIEKVFHDARGHSAVLVFDEAEGLFGSRTSNGCATDKLMNADVGRLLWQMENFPGIVILITNIVDFVDEAFFRRLKFKIKFEKPRQEVRNHLWKAHIPDKCPIADDIDFDSLAREELTGGEIKSVVFRAACRAAVRDDEDAKLTMSDLSQALEEEVNRDSKSVTPTMFL
eukprot:TRINITY_DN61676_c0_g1_i1.p1 TRINITY_DN61676_c0_g1~~TRINITY_DN61676_c0_g1_i1.p1  ORF type:complete len:1039 (+),score=112.61 TRINITY_DN61676_c0_g1_i1:442-3117(+)